MLCFRFGKNENLHGLSYIGYGLEGLLYDAWRGVPVSMSLIYTYFSTYIERGENPPFQIMEFVAYQVKQAAEPETNRENMLFPHGRRKSSFEVSPAIVDSVMFLKSSGFNVASSRDGDSAFLMTAKMEYGTSKAESKETPVRNEYYRGLARMKRIKRVSEILKYWYRPQASTWKERLPEFEEQNSWHELLDREYNEITKLD